MATVNKSTGKYFFENERVWEETLETGVPPFYVGDSPSQFANDPTALRKRIESACRGLELPRVNANRVGCFDITYSMSKSFSIVIFGLHSPDQWKDWIKPLSEFVKSELDTLVRSQIAKFGAQGRTQTPSQGFAVVFSHWRGFLGQPHGHWHGCIPNWTKTALGEIRSIGNSHLMFERQGESRARFQKHLDDLAQSKGFETKRVGKRVEIARVPESLIYELSPSRRAMAEAKTSKHFDSAKVRDIAAREARRTFPRRETPTPKQAHERVLEAAKHHGVTLESVRGRVTHAKSEQHATIDALGLAKQARDWCARRYGDFSATQFRERFTTLTIGTPIKLPQVDRVSDLFLRDQELSKLRFVVSPDGQVKFATEESKKQERRADRQFVREAWDGFKIAAKDLGKAVLVSTLVSAAEALKRMKEHLDRPPQIRRIDARDLDSFIARHKPTHYVLAHAKAILSGILSRGNPHERAAYAEAVYRHLRSHQRMPKETVLIVERSGLADAKQLRDLAKIAKRDKGWVVLTKRPPHRAYEKQKLYEFLRRREKDASRDKGHL